MQPFRDVDGVTENRLLAGVSVAERARLQVFLHAVEMPDRWLLAGPGDAIRDVWFPTDAVISVVADMEDGESVEVGLIGTEGMAGLGILFGAGRSATRTMVQIAGTGQRMSAADFTNHVVEPRGELYRLVMRYANTFMTVVAQGAACNARHSAEQRLARWLLTAHDRVNRDRFHLTHDFIAMMIGIRRPSVTEVMGMLRDVGGIEYSHGDIRIVERTVLEGRACACYAVIRREIDDGSPDYSPH
jgi:CRP-like cAMP-binding protein